jgi:2-polyprenyl-3-methyl-5-hydroxy-6-metoxy-1,4-benzoquinol methylase
MFMRPLVLELIEDRQMEGMDFAENTFRPLHEALILSREVREIRKLLKVPNPTLLDIGCGTGWTTAYWMRQGFAVTGVEPSISRIELATERFGFKIIRAYIEDLDVNNKYDVIVLRHVIEHLEDPLSMLKKAMRFLSDNGKMFIVVPNIDCIGKHLFDIHWDWVLPFHCNFFSVRSAQSLINNAGLKVERSYQTPSTLFYGDSFARKYPSSIASRLINFNAVTSALFAVPFSLAGVITGYGDNLTLIASK